MSTLQPAHHCRVHANFASGASDSVASSTQGAKWLGGYPGLPRILGPSDWHAVHRTLQRRTPRPLCAVCRKRSEGSGSAMLVRSAHIHPSHELLVGPRHRLRPHPRSTTRQLSAKSIVSCRASSLLFPPLSRPNRVSFSDDGDVYPHRSTIRADPRLQAIHAPEAIAMRVIAPAAPRTDFSRRRCRVWVRSKWPIQLWWRLPRMRTI